MQAKDKEIITMKAGDVCYGASPLVVSTVLGPCVAVTMFCRRTGLWAVCHAMRPERPLFDKEKGGQRLEFVDEALEYMLKKFAELGIKEDEIEVMVFGGATFLGPFSHSSLGAANANKARKLLAKKGLKLTFADTGGNAVRSILFYTAIGKVVLRFHNAGNARESRKIELMAASEDRVFH